MSFLSDLRDQLFILAGVKTSFDAELVPACIGRGVASRVSFNGICYSLFSSQQLLQDRLDQIRVLFEQATTRLTQAYDLYIQNFHKENSGKPFDNDQKTKGERRILQIFTYLNPFIKPLLDELDLPYVNFLRENHKKESFYIFFYAKIVQKTKNLELTTGVLVPFQSLLRLHANLELNAEQTDRLDAWLKALNDSKSLKVATFRGDKKNPYVAVRALHRYLLSLTLVLYWDPIKLEMALIKKGCTLFDDPDPKWIKARKNVKNGDSICIEGKDYTIDTCVFNPGNDRSLPMVFSIQNQESVNLVIYPNEAYGSIRLRREKQDHYGVETARQLGRQDAISIVERLYHPLNSISWESSDECLSDSDAIRAHPIVGLLEGLSLQPYTPSPLAPDLFAFTLDNEMRALQVMSIKEGPMSFESIEDFTFACSLNSDGSINSSVFTYLMHAGKLVDLPHAKAYQDLMLMSLEEREMDYSVSLDGIFPDLLDYRKEFFLKVQAYKKTIIDEILTLYQVLDVKKLHERLVSAFQVVHTRDSPGRLFLPSFQERCKRHLLLDLKPGMKPLLLSPIRKDLIGRISRSNLGERAVALSWQEEKKYYLLGIYNKEQQREIYYQGENGYKINKKS